MKKLLLLGAAVCGLLSTSVAKAEDPFEVDGLYYQPLSDGIGVEVTAVPKGGTAYTGDIVIPSYVKQGAITYRVLGIGDEAFAYCDEVTTIKCSDTMKRLGTACFRGCSVQKIDLGQGIEQMCEDSFGFGCMVEEISEFPACLNQIDGCPFVGAKKLKEFKVSPDNPYFTAIDGVLFSKSGKTMRAFPWGKGTSYVIPEGTDSIAANIFNSCSTMLEITFPSTLKYVDTQAFIFLKKCVNMNNLPEGVEWIGPAAFSTCWKMSITCPSTVKFIGGTAFKQVRLATEIVVPEGIEEIKMNTFDGCWSATKLTIGEGVKLIDDMAFANCSAVTEDVILPSTVKNLGAYVFQGMSKVKVFDLPAALDSIGTGAFNGLAPEKVICRAVNPPKYKIPAFGTALWNIAENMTNSTLYVPAGSAEAYKTAEGWDQFGNYVELPQDGVEDFEVADAEVVGETYYNLSGMAINAPKACDGQMYIVVRKMSDGSVKTSKVYNK